MRSSTSSLCGPDEVSWKGEALLERGLRELGVEPLPERGAALVVARDDASRALDGELTPWELVGELGSLWVEIEQLPELAAVAEFFFADAYWGRRESGVDERQILEATRAFLAADGEGR